jgi:hypothetical protein
MRDVKIEPKTGQAGKFECYSVNMLAPGVINTLGYGVNTWNSNWAWSLPLIVLKVVIHVFGLVFISEQVDPILSGAIQHLRFVPLFAPM